jgi:hypothetical protein
MEHLDEFFRRFGIVHRHELIALRECLATELITAFQANDAAQAAVIEELLNRTESLLERFGRHEVSTEIQATEFSGAN